nr:hypothetical protein Iba_chr05aCG8050 [Ipomoea batatas]
MCGWEIFVNALNKTLLRYMTYFPNTEPCYEDIIVLLPGGDSAVVGKGREGRHLLQVSGRFYSSFERISLQFVERGLFELYLSWCPIDSETGKLYVGYLIVVKWFFSLLIGIGEFLSMILNSFPGPDITSAVCQCGCPTYRTYL